MSALPLLTKRLVTVVWLMGAVAAAPGHAANLARSPSETYQVTQRSLPLTRLDEQPTQAIVAYQDVAMVHRGQSLGLLRRGTRSVLPLAPLPMHINPSFGAVCAAGKGFVVALHSVAPGERPAMGTAPVQPAAPGMQGLYYFKVDGPGAGTELQFIEALRITARPRPADMPFAYQGPNTTRGPITDCAWDGQQLYVALPGALGRVNLERRTVDLLNVDDPAGLIAQRGPIGVDSRGVWLGYDEGSSGQSWLKFHPTRGPERAWSMAWHDDPVAVAALARHQGQLFVGTSHGLFRLDEGSGRLVYQDLGEGMPGAYINGLHSDAEALWVFNGGQWLRLNTRAKTATWFVTQPQTTLVTGVPFEDYWLVGGPQGVWRTPPRIKPETPPAPPARSRQQSRQPR